MAGCRSGHNGLDLKSCVSARIRPVGSNPTPAASAYISIGLEMINRPMHYFLRKVAHLMKKDHQLSANYNLTNVSFETKK